MNNKTLALAAVAALTLTTAPAFAADRTNGISFNGINFNGLKMNGLKVNGMKVNGLQMNGLKWNGIQFNGKMFNGRLFNGRMFNGTGGGSQATVTPTVTTVRLSSGEALGLR